MGISELKPASNLCSAKIFENSTDISSGCFSSALSTYSFHLNLCSNWPHYPLFMCESVLSSSCSFWSSVNSFQCCWVLVYFGCWERKLFVVWFWSKWLTICLEIFQLPAHWFHAQICVGFWFSPMLVIAGLWGLTFLLVVVKETWSMQCPSFGELWSPWSGSLTQRSTNFLRSQFAIRKKWCTIQSFFQNLLSVPLYHIHQQVVCCRLEIAF